MKKIVATVCSAFLLAFFSASGEGGPRRVGIVLPGDQWVSSIDGLREGMKALGYVEGKDVRYLLENASGDKKRVAALTEKFVAEKVDVIFTITNTALKIVAQVARPTKTPVVFGSASGPVESGIIPAYATPDAHVTGVTSGSIELVAKRLEILTEVLPRARRIAAIGDLEADSSRTAFALAAVTAGKLGLSLIPVRVKSKEEAVEDAKGMTPDRVDAVFLIPGLHSVGAVKGLAAVARTTRVPLAVYQVEHVRRHGALLSYGSSYYLQSKQAAALVDKILKGVPAAQLPIEWPKLHQLILNLDTAREIGVSFSRDVLSRADELVGGEAKR
jgi:putative ABC transport system substrate-binding protein